MFDLEHKGSRLVLTLNRPPVNAINDEWLNRLHAILDDLDRRDDISVLHIRSAQKIFCAGMDVAHIHALTQRADGAEAMVADVTKFQQAFARIEALAQVVIAEIGGAALGGGLELALACDLRVASDRAKIGLPEAKLGLIPGAGGTQRLTWLCGRGVAAQLILTGDVISGAEAQRLGVVQWSVEHETLQTECEAIAERIARLSSQSVREAKRLIGAALDHSRDGFAEERDADRRLFASADTQRRLEKFITGQR
ncbi:MAG: enoyl-CoA hydratase/isomerase family protein [Burkholderiaceae bacterium]|nr:enoyl-CoA hydratase/isomerase family protein [Burkholderiaceae bacterium]